jgi:predicted AlkP superfamily pyrophosphatase or phosphodiesterase
VVARADRRIIKHVIAHHAITLLPYTFRSNMSLSHKIEKQIRAERDVRFKKLNLPTEFIAPNYSGRSIVNIPATIIRALGGHFHTPPLDPEMTKGLTTNVQRVVFVIADATGYQRLLDALEANPQNGFHKLLRRGAQLVPITSTFPSTTTAALTTLWSGYTPAEHGFVGYQLFLREQGVRADMIAFSPVATKNLGAQQLVDAGLEPEKFLPIPSLPQTLEHFGIPVYNFIEAPYAGTALARVQIRGAKETYGFVTSSDMWVVLRQVIEQHRAERALFVAYWSAIDGIAHRYGPSHDAVIAELNNLAYSFESEFLRKLSPAAREGTLFLLTADHGQLDTPPERAVFWRAHPELREHLVMDFAGEARAVYLYCRNGEVNMARAYIETRLGDKFFVLDSRDALDAGLFGSGKRAPELKHRIGDLIALPRENYFCEEHEEVKMRGRHGGLGEEEMLVPLIAARLDA